MKLELIYFDGCPNREEARRDVTGEAAGAGGPACRADGAPSVEAIRAALEG